MKIQKKQIVIAIIILIILVITWGDKFNYKNQDNLFDSKFEYFNNYEELKDKYIKSNVYRTNGYGLKEVAQKVEDIDFLRFIVEKQNINENDEIEYLESLLNLYIFEKKYTEAEELAYLIKDDKRYYNIYRSNGYIYEKLIDIYYEKNDKDSMIALFEELKELENRILYDMKQESLKKLINLINDDEVKEEILNNQIQMIKKTKEINIWDLVFILDIAGYGSEEMKNIMYIGEKINSEESNKDWKIENFIKIYPIFKNEKYIYFNTDFLITEKENKYIIRYYNKDSGNIENKEIIDKPRDYKVYEYINFIVKNSGSYSILLEYDDKTLVKEKIGKNILNIDIVDDVVVENNLIISKMLDVVIDIRGELVEKNVYLDDYMAYEILKFKNEDKITDVMLKEYRVLETGYLEFVNIKKIISY